MKQLLLLYLLVTSQIVFGQDKLVFKGTVNGYEGKVKLILNRITDDHEADMESEEIIYMIDGQFKIERKLEKPTLLSIRIRPEITEDFDPRSFESAFIWVDNTEMTLYAEKGNFEYCDVSGYSRQDDYEKSIAYVGDRLRAHRKLIDSLSKIQTKDAIKKAEQLKSISSIYLRNKYRLDYSYRHPNSFVSVYNFSWFVKWLPEMVPKSHALEFYEMLDEPLQNSIHGRQIRNYIDHSSVNKRLNVGDRFYNFTLPDSSSVDISLSSFEGKIILLDFWASSCGPCRKEHVNYTELYEQFNESGFEIISVSQDRRREPWLKAMKRDNMTWISLWDEDLSISKYMYLVSSIPDNYLINRDGIIMAKNIRGNELRRFLTEIIEE